MRKSQNYDIFISYRREGGYDTAQLLYDRLTQMRYRVSFDLETLRGGKFNTQLYQRIEQCSDVLVVMSKDSLMLRENPDDDWFRLEIAHALKHKKNIVPVFLRDFAFPQKKELPPDIADLVDYQGVTASQEHFDSVLQHICRNFKARPRRRIGMIVGIAAFALTLALGAGIGFNADRIFPYPFTRTAKQQVDEYAGAVIQIGGAYNEFLLAKVEFLERVGLSVESGDSAPYQEAVPIFLHRLGAAKRQFASASESLERVVRGNADLRVDRAYIPNFIEGIREDMGTADDWAALFKLPCDPDYPCSKTDRIRLVRLHQKEVEIYADVFAYSIMALFDMISPKVLGDFQEIATKQWTAVKRFRGEWLSNQKQIEYNADASLNQLQEVIGEIAQIIGDKKLALEQAKRDTRQMRIDAGMSTEQADRMGKKEDELFNWKARLNVSQKALADVRESLREKFAPKEDDDAGMLWSKALRFMSVKMPEDAKLCVDALRRRNVADFPSTALDAAEAFFLAKDKLPFWGGVLVCGFEPPATSHAIYKIGDIIAEINGEPCLRFENYSGKAGNTVKINQKTSLRFVNYSGKAGNSHTIYRLNANGGFDRVSAVMPDNQPRVALVNLIEESQTTKEE